MKLNKTAKIFNFCRLRILLRNSKKAQAWKYILAAILALITIGVIVWILFKQKTGMQDIIAKLREII